MPLALAIVVGALSISRHFTLAFIRVEQPRALPVIRETITQSQKIFSGKAGCPIICMSSEDTQICLRC
jgi:hypothetical protein